MINRNSFKTFLFLTLSGFFASTLYGGEISLSPQELGAIKVAYHNPSGPISVAGGTILRPNGIMTFAASGTAPNGNTWDSYVRGTNPVAYYDGDGSLMFDPKGRNVTLIDFRYGTIDSISISTPGPFLYATGTTPAISTGEIARTLPAGSWAATTAFPARLSGSVTFTNTPSLFTSGGNIASTNGWFNVGWSFGSIAPGLTQELMYSTSAGQGFRAVVPVGHDPVNLLGYGNGIGMFTWIEGGVSGVRYGAVIPLVAVPVPEPSTWVMVAGGLACAGLGTHWRRRKLAGC